MNSNLPRFSMVMTSDDEDVKRATEGLRSDLADLKQEAAQSAPAFDRHAEALNKEAAAADRAAKANRELAAAERNAREEAARASGSRPQPAAQFAPYVPQRPTPQPPAVPPRQPPPPANENDREGQFRRQNLTYQAFDIGQSLAGGMPLGMILAQQGPQIAQLYAGPGGANAAIKDFGAIAANAAKLVTPLTVSIGGVTAAAAIGAAAWSSYLRSTKEVETAAAGLGRATAGTAAAMEASARAGAAAAGISVASARSMEAQFLRTGKIGSENFEQLIALSKNFGATVSMDADNAGAALAEMFADPAKAAQVLYQQYGLIDAATVRQATNLAKQNRESEAQAVLLKALPNQLADAEAATTALGRAWDMVATGASNAYNWMGQAIDRVVSGPSLETRLEEARHKARLPWWLGGGASAKEELAQLESEKESADNDAAVKQREAEWIRRSQAAVAAATGSGANSSAIRQQTLRNEIAAIQNGRDGLTGEDARQADAALDAKQRVLEALINRQQRLSELDQLDIQIQTERNPLLRAELEARRTRLEMAEQEVSAEEVGNAAARARNRVVEETIGGAQRQAQDMQEELEVRTRLNAMVASGTVTTEDANRMLQEELTLRPLIAAAATAEGDAKDRLNKVISDLRSGYEGLAAQQKLSAALDYLKTGNDRIEQLRVEQALIGANDNVRARSMARLQAEQEIRRRGLDSNSSLAAQIRDQADAMAQLNRQIDKQTEAWSSVQQAGEDAIDGVVDKLGDGDFGGALDAVKDALAGFVKDDIKANLQNALLGTDKGTASDIGGIGGIFSRLLNGGKGDPSSIVSGAMGRSVSAMSVTAGVVNINGGAAGSLGGLFSGAANDNTAGGFSGLGKVIPVARAPLPDIGSIGADTDVASYIAKAASLRGIDPGVALAVAKSEGGLKSWNLQSAYVKNGVQEPSFGPFQLYKGGGLGNDFMRQTGLDPAIAANGPAGVDFALDHAAKNGWSAWYGAGKAGISNWQGIGGAPQGGSAVDAVNKLAAASGQATTSLADVSASAGTATQGLGNLGVGFDQVGKSLTSFFPAAPSAPSGGGLGGIFSSLFGGGLSAAQVAKYTPMVGLFDRGGYTGPGGIHEPRGVVHAGEIVWSQRDIAKAGGVQTVEAMRLGRRGYAGGGVVSSNPTFYATASGRGASDFGTIGTQRNAPIIYNFSDQKVDYQEETDQQGNRQPIITLGQMSASAVKQRGNPLRASLQSEFNLTPRRKAR